MKQETYTWKALIRKGWRKSQYCADDSSYLIPPNQGTFPYVLQSGIALLLDKVPLEQIPLILAAMPGYLDDLCPSLEGMPLATRDPIYQMKIVIPYLEARLESDS